MTRILVVDDNAFMRKMLKQLIETEKDFQVVAEAENIQEALNKVSQIDLDLILIDVSLEGEDTGIQLIQQIRKLGKETPILSVSLHEKSIYADRLRRVGAQGYLMKQEAVENIIPAIRELNAGHSYWS